MRSTRTRIAARVVAAVAVHGGGLAAAAAPASVGPGVSTPDAAGSGVQTLVVDGQSRRFRLHLPPDATGDATPRALVLVFHGAGSSAAQQEGISRLSDLADFEGFLVAYPDALDARWQVTGQDNRDLRFVDAMVTAIRSRHPVDPSRVFAAGISNGAQMTLQVACARPGLLAGIALVAGAYPAVCGPGRPPAVVFHGTADRVLPYEGGAGHLPVRRFAAEWAAGPGCPSPEPTMRSRRGDATGEQWACGRHQALLYTLEGKGHAWPGSSMAPDITSRDVDASAEAWRFFQSVRPAR